MFHHYLIFYLKQMAYSGILNANDKQNKEISVMKITEQPRYLYL